MTEAHRTSTERIGAALTQAGLPRLPSRVFAALLVDDDGRMTSTELAAALDVSAASISGAVGFLERIGYLRRERERGSRRDVYVVDDDAWHEAIMRKDEVYAPIRTSLEHAISALGPDAPAQPRLTIAREFLIFIQEEFDALTERWEERKAELGY